jgi:hypothetical protein
MPMKNAKLFSGLILVLMTQWVSAQGTFSIDQQAGNDNATSGSLLTIHPNQPTGQSFTPNLSRVDFIRLFLIDPTINGQGGSMVVHLRDGSLAGPILGSTEPVNLTDGVNSSVDLLFNTAIAVTPGVAYYFQPVLISGDSTIGALAYNGYAYPGGGAYYQGGPLVFWDYWFREGIVVPEPSAAVLILAGLAMTRFIRRSR